MRKSVPQPVDWLKFFSSLDRSHIFRLYCFPAILFNHSPMRTHPKIKLPCINVKKTYPHNYYFQEPQRNFPGSRWRISKGDRKVMPSSSTEIWTHIAGFRDTQSSNLKLNQNISFPTTARVNKPTWNLALLENICKN